MKKFELLIATSLAAGFVTPAMAQDNNANAPIIVTAQRQAQTLQEVPIAVSAFTAEALERQQIENASDLQLSLPNVSFTKTNFTSSSFTIRGVGDLCVGTSCDSATGIHLNDQPLLGSRLFEQEYYDLERIEVLRGPQGTLFGRNATSGVVNFITARPDLSEFAARGSFEYGNFDSMRAEGMVNVPIGDWAGIRIAGYYLNRDGYTYNEYNDTDVDGRDQYSIRGSLRLEPGPDTTIDIIGTYFEEDDNRSRIQKQLCARDDTGVLGCRPDALANEVVNGNSTLAAVLSSNELFAIQSAPFAAVDPGLPATLTALGLTSIYGTDQYANATNPSDLRRIRADFDPTYYAEEWLIQGRLEHDFGPVALTLIGGYGESEVDSRTDYNLSAADPFGVNTGLFTLAALAGGAGGPALQAVFAPVAAALIPNGPTGNACVSEASLAYSGIYGGNVYGCAPQSIEYDRSSISGRQYSVEAHIDSDLDGPFNFLLGAIYVNTRTYQNDYFVNAFGLDYAAGVLGGFTTLGAAGALPPSFLGPPFFNSETDSFTLESYGLFGEVYFDITDNLRLTGGIRYSNDDKYVRSRSPILAVPVPIGTTDANPTISAGFDADGVTAGQQAYREFNASFDEVTGRIVLDWQWSPNNLVYASWSRGYKSGGINPPFDPIFSVPATFNPEIINAFEVGSKNTLANGAVQINATAFMYDYQDLQLSRILNRTSFNDNTDATVWGLELEAIISPDPAWLFNISASTLSTSIGNTQLVDTRDPSGGRSDTVIIKDLSNGANCAVIPQAVGNAAGANAFVNAINANALGLQPTVPVPGTNTTGAYSICSILQAGAAGQIAAVNPALAALQPLLDSFGAFSIADGVPVDLSGNELPLAPDYKITVGGQYTADFDNGMSLVLRADYSLTGQQYARSFNRAVDRIETFGIANAQVQLNGADDRWFVRAFIQNIFDNDAITGHYLTDPSSGLFTNVFTLEPRRYGLAAGFRF
ncbi:TonB-dependent receptor [Parasphingopyxis marina]|nr:TonB-dependent receptor [Parasphingopyxis marina]